MTQRRLKTALLGLNQKGQELLAVVSDIPAFEIFALADTNSDVAQKLGGVYNCRYYDDYRQLVIQNQLDVLIISAPLRSCYEYVKTAIQKKTNILKLPPMASSFAEAAELAQLAKNADVAFTVLNLYRFADSFLELRRYLLEKGVDDAYLLSVLYTICSDKSRQEQRWSSDPKLSGGGILLNGCYELLDEIILNFSLPQQVYAIKTNQSPDRKQRQYLTEETAVVTMKFADSLTATLTATEAVGPDRQELEIYAKDGKITVTPDGINAVDETGKTVMNKNYNQNEEMLLRKALNNFAQSILTPGVKNLCGSTDENLAVMAMLESAYLSANTAMPEQPGRIFQMSPVAMPIS